MNEAEDHPLGYLLYRVMAVLRPQATAELKRQGLGLPEFVCLRILSMFPGRSNAQLARDTNMSAQSMNQLLQGLQDRGAVSRPATVPSGRALPAQLTPKGKSLLKRAEATVHENDQRILAHLTPAEQRQLKHLLFKAGSGAADHAATPARGVGPSD